EPREQDQARAEDSCAGDEPRSEHALTEHELRDAVEDLRRRRVLEVEGDDPVDVLPAGLHVGELVAAQHLLPDVPAADEQTEEGDDAEHGPAPHATPLLHGADPRSRGSRREPGCVLPLRASSPSASGVSAAPTYSTSGRRPTP